jgi:glycosyltransferase involved in cell wall biosynthesis
VPLTATIHDMTCWLMPELHTPANVIADKAFAERVKRAAGLIAVSENTKRDAVELLNLDPDRVQVIYSGIAEPYFRTTADAVLRVVQKYDLKRPYILYVGTIEPRKNVDTLLDAYQQLPNSIRSDAGLVIAGPMGWASESTRRRLEESKNGVRYLGYVPEDDLPALMAGAIVFTYLSRYEGFGFPVAQSMACGVPVVVSNSSSLPEVAGDAGLLVDPESPSEVAATLDRLLTGAELRSDLSQRGRTRAEQFRWGECARRSLDFFHNLP